MSQQNGPYPSEWIRPSVNLIVETDEEGTMEVTYVSMDNEEVWRLVVFLIERLSRATGIDYNAICNDLKYIEEGE